MTATRIAVAAASALLLLMLLVSAAAAAVVESLTAPWDALDIFSSTGSKQLPDADGDIPVRVYEIYHEAAATCPGLPWSVLAGMGKVASDHGRRVNGRGVMGISREQFDQHAQPVPIGGASPASPLDPIDATFATARMLCEPSPVSDVRSALNRVIADPETAVRTVELADLYAHAPQAGTFIATAARSAPSPAARLAVEYAGAQLGSPTSGAATAQTAEAGTGLTAPG